jgi:hypothetical protein
MVHGRAMMLNPLEKEYRMLREDEADREVAVDVVADDCRNPQLGR